MHLIQEYYLHNKFHLLTLNLLIKILLLFFLKYIIIINFNIFIITFHLILCQTNIIFLVNQLYIYKIKNSLIFCVYKYLIKYFHFMHFYVKYFFIKYIIINIYFDNIFLIIIHSMITSLFIKNFILFLFFINKMTYILSGG